MDARAKRFDFGQDTLDERGQGIVEFILVLPVLFVLTALLIRVSTVIQMAIVNQKYSRAQALFLTYNSPYYPELRFKEDPSFGSMIMGVADNVAGGAGEEFEPRASTFVISRPGKPLGSDDPQDEPDERGRIRIRNTITLCAPFNEPITEDIQFDYCRGLSG